jgi:hypothetical protein
MLTANYVLHDIFIHNHKAAALMAKLSTHHFEKLNNKNILKIGTGLLHKINQSLQKTGEFNNRIEG